MRKSLVFWGVLCLVLLLAGLPFLGACAKPVPVPTPTAVPTPTTAPTPTAAPTPTPTPSPAPQKVIELKFAHFNPPTAWAQTSWSNPWCQKIEEVTKGRVKVTVYPARTLANEQQTYQAVEYGVADMGWIVSGFYTGRFPCSEIINLPFLGLAQGTLDGKTVSAGQINSRILWEIYEKFPQMQAEWSTVKMLYLISSSPAFVSTVKKPVRSQADLKGLKLRALGGGQTDALKALGAAPVSMPIPEVYEAASKGIIDGMATQWAQIASNRLYDVFRYTTPDISLGLVMMAVPMNLNKWNSLPKDIQDAIWGISGSYGAEFAGSTAWGYGEKDAVLADSKKAGKEMEWVSPDPGEAEKWEAIAGKPLWDKWITDMKAKGLPGQELLDEALRLKGVYK